MTRTLVTGLLPLLVACSAAPAAAAGATPLTGCEALVHVALSGARVTATEPLAAGAGVPAPAGAITLERRVCRVTIVATPAAGSRIGIELWLPDPQAWNDRFWGLGSGGFAGSVAHARLAEGTAAGYAVVSTDGGNDTPGSTAWARGAPERVADLGHRAVHLAAVHGKRVTEAYYGRPPRFAYFSGFSTGGTQGLMLAQRHPDDYDGILAGAGDQDWTKLYLGLARFQFRWLPDSAHHVSRAQLEALQAAALATCGTDGVVEAPERCRAEDVIRAYRSSAAAPPLTAKQRQSLRALYSGSFDGSGRPTPFGYVPGTEASWSGTHFGPEPGTAPLRAYFLTFCRDFVYANTTWTDAAFNPVRIGADTERVLARDFDATDPDIRAFLRRGGRLLLWHGWSDHLVPPGLTVHYHRRVAATVGPAASGRGVRRFMAPGVGHGASGPGATQFGQFAFGDGDAGRSLAAALQRWVEDGRPPACIVAARHATPSDPRSALVGTRRICAS